MITSDKLQSGNFARDAEINQQEGLRIYLPSVKDWGRENLLNSKHGEEMKSGSFEAE